MKIKEVTTPLAILDYFLPGVINHTPLHPGVEWRIFRMSLLGVT
jgi:hypothetical protein